MNLQLRTAFRQYCIKNDLFSSGSINQYEKVIEKVEHCFNNKNASHALTATAAMIWICSDTAKTVLDIESDLLDMFLQII